MEKRAGGDHAGEASFEPWPEIGALIREARKAIKPDLSARAAAARAGFSEGYWRQIEKGYEKNKGLLVPVNPSDVKLARMCGVVGLDPVEIFRRAGRQWREELRFVVELSPEERLARLESQMEDVLRIVRELGPQP